ncbi:hypothetical protein LOAG_04460 [Loa loa]|uniref:Agenet domain-containing protein n=1 Tax=Loa loa TaxID=7209 RepID=A0A1I7VXP5_LOALO|nr:hypothetical protein LOAG_04460 [Loa loa]EFO24019.1 hypothetical protein LOAG_04460 [Loa loa]
MEKQEAKKGPWFPRLSDLNVDAKMFRSKRSKLVWWDGLVGLRFLRGTVEIFTCDLYMENAVCIRSDTKSASDSVGMEWAQGVDSSWYRVERILSEKYERRGARLEKLYEILWAPTWEPAKRISAQVPLIVEAYEKEKQKSFSNGESSETNTESFETAAKPSAQGSKRTRNSKKIKIIGMVSDNGRNVENSTLLVENEHSGEQWCMQYEDIKRDYSIELIEFFEGCVSGFTK